MDTFLSVPAHFTGSPLISPRSRIDPWLHRRLTEITKGKKRRGRGRRIKDWPLGYYCTKKREEGTARYSGPRADEDTVARVTRLNLRSYNSNWHPNRVPRDERISILFSARAEGSPILPSFLPSFLSSFLSNEIGRNKEAVARVYPRFLATSDTRELIQDARTTRASDPRRLNPSSLLSLSARSRFLIFTGRERANAP